MDERTARARRARARNRKIERRLKGFASLELDPAEVRASRDFHFHHWLKVAGAAVRRDHREMYFKGLSPNVASLLADYPADDFPPEMQAAVLRDLAFLEGHLEAYRDVLKLLEAHS